MRFRFKRIVTVGIHMIRFKAFFFLLLVGWILHHSPLEAEKVDFGRLRVKIDQQPSETFEIKGSIILENVTLKFDTTVFLQDPKQLEVLYYPQFASGKGNWLVLILSKDKRQYDFYLDLGDSLTPSIHWEKARQKIYFIPNSQLMKTAPLSDNISGTVSLDLQNQKKEIPVSLNLEFDLIPPGASGNIQHVTLSGDFTIYRGTFREASVASVAALKEKGKKQRNNLFIVLIMAGLMIIIFGFK